MGAPTETYEPRYLAGIVLFNRHDFFEAHEVWESLWQDCSGPERRYYQGLIQAAVGLLHFGNGNLRGAIKLYGSSRDYMERYGSPYLGLDTKEFWRQMEHCFAGVLAGGPDGRVDLDAGLIPEIKLDPPPASWPDPAEYVEHDA
jgi:hypothetical protein